MILTDTSQLYSGYMIAKSFIERFAFIIFSFCIQKAKHVGW